MATERFLIQTLARLKYLWWLKAIGTCCFMLVFFHFYFLVMRSPLQPVYILSASALDHAIPFQAQWFYVYASLWVYASVAPALMPGFLSLLKYGVFVGLLCVIGLIIFYIYPTAVPFDTSLYANAILLKPLHELDKTGNALPSLHVGCALFTALTLHRCLRDMNAAAWMMWINAAWCAAIVYSTLAIKQHTVIDVLAGAGLAVLVFAAYRIQYRWRTATSKPKRNTP
jgi:membrane-associated phospholipid phosphatase